MDLLLVARQPNASTIPPTQPSNEPSSNQSFESWATQYWYVLLIVLAVLVVLCVLVCACILRHKPRGGGLPSLHHREDPHVSVPEDNGYSSSQQSTTMPSLSGGSTPVPSPNSSQQSVRVPSGQSHINGRSRRTSPRLSSTSSDTLRPGAHSVSSNSSSTSLMGGHSPSRQSPMERQGSLSRKTRPMVRVTSMPDVPTGGVVGGAGLRTAPSTVSVESSSSGRSGISYRFQPVADSDAIVEVGVTVHTPGDPDKAVRIATAAALAESARKLAQEAASFIDDQATDDHTHSKLMYSHRPGSGRSSLRYPIAPPTSYYNGERHYMSQSTMVSNYQRTPSIFPTDSDYQSYRGTSPSLDSTISGGVDNFNYSRGRSRSLYTQPHLSNYVGAGPRNFELHPPRRSSDVGLNQYRRPGGGVYNKRDTPPTRKVANLDYIRSDRRLTTPISSPEIDNGETTSAGNRVEEFKKKKVSTDIPINRVEALEGGRVSNLSLSPSTSTGLSSTTHTENSSQFSIPSQDTPAPVIKRPVQSVSSSESNCTEVEPPSLSTSPPLSHSPHSTANLSHTIECITANTDSATAVGGGGASLRTINEMRRPTLNDNDDDTPQSDSKKREGYPTITDTNDPIERDPPPQLKDTPVVRRYFNSDDTTQSSLDSEESIQDADRRYNIQRLSHLRGSYHNKRTSERAGGYLERTSFNRQNSLPRFSRPYSPSGGGGGGGGGERRLSLSRQSYQPYSHTISSSSLPPPLPLPSSVADHVTVDV